MGALVAISSEAVHDRIGRNYATIRPPAPRLAEPLWQALGDARTLSTLELELARARTLTGVRASRSRW
jgi:hypothetical protein